MNLISLAVLSLINFNYILGDRTLVSNVSRMPWHWEIGYGRKKIAKKVYEFLRADLYDNVIMRHSVI